MLFHGWAFDASVWDGVVAHLLPGLVVHRAERGYFGATPVEDWPPWPVLAVGHSLGALLAVASGRAQGLLAINGFARLTATGDWPAGIASRPLERMLSRLADRPGAVVAEFRALHGAPLAGSMPLVVDRLAQDLCLLRDTDARVALAAFDGPVRALAGRNDALVSPALAQASFGANLTLIDGAHLLPLTEPALCAAKITEMATAL